MLVSGEFSLSRGRTSRRRRAGELPTERDGRIFPAIPFAIRFFLAIEELPLAAESRWTRSATSAGDAVAMTTLVITGALTLCLNTGVNGGALDIGVSATPLFDGFKAVFGEGTRRSCSA